MPQITAGYIIYSEQAQPGTFGSPKGEARFDFGVEQGEDYEAVANKAAREARSYVRRLIGLEKSKVAELAAVTSPSQGSPPAPAQVAAAVPGLKEAAAASMNAADQAPAKPRRGRPPAAEKVETAPAKPVEAAAEDWETADPAAPVETKPVTDYELTDATSRKYKTLGTGDATSEKIRALTKQYHGGPPKQLRDIPQERRADYLAKLETLV